MKRATNASYPENEDEVFFMMKILNLSTDEDINRNVYTISDVYFINSINIYIYI